MNNARSLSFFANMAQNNPDSLSVKITKASDFSDRDAEFILRHACDQSEILDLASGTGLIINRICDKVKRIVAVEAFSEFSQFIRNKVNIKIINENIINYHTLEKFDLVTMFGIVSYFNEEEILILYKRLLFNLKHSGKLIIKNQFGVEDDVIVSGYSPELKTDYHSQYRHVDKEVRILALAGFRDIEVIDIYPPECNRWTNTHFYALVASL